MICTKIEVHFFKKAAQQRVKREDADLHQDEREQYWTFFIFFSFFGAASVLILRLKFNSVSASLRFFFFKPFFFLFFFLHFIFHKRFSSSRKVSSFHFKRASWCLECCNSQKSVFLFTICLVLRFMSWMDSEICCFVRCLLRLQFFFFKFCILHSCRSCIEVCSCCSWFLVGPDQIFFIFYNFTQKIVTSGKLLTLVP